MSYHPSPIDTSSIELTSDLRELVELLAHHVHDVWAQQRLSEGWRYWPQRNDTLKEHPDLVPYEELPEGEKEYDRRTATETVKVVLALGYWIEPPPDHPPSDTEPRPGRTRRPASLRVR